MLEPLKQRLAKYSRKQLAIGGAVLLTATSALSVGLYQASVKNQICLSYERQLTTELNSGLKILQDTKNAKDVVTENPFAAFGLIGQLTNLLADAQGFKTKSNDLLYAFKGTCGETRWNTWAQQPENKSLYNQMQTLIQQLGQ